MCFPSRTAAPSRPSVFGFLIGSERDGDGSSSRAFPHQATGTALRSPHSPFMSPNPPAAPSSAGGTVSHLFRSRRRRTRLTWKVSPLSGGGTRVKPRSDPSAQPRTAEYAGESLSQVFTLWGNQESGLRRGASPGTVHCGTGASDGGPGPSLAIKKERVSGGGRTSESPSSGPTWAVGTPVPCRRGA